MGLLIKNVMLRDSLDAKGPNGVPLQQEFDLTSNQIEKIIEHGCRLWMTLKQTYERALEKQNQPEQNYLKKQFDEAHECLLEKVKNMNSVHKPMFTRVVNILQGNERKRK